MRTSRQKKRGKCIKACASNAGRSCNCSAKCLRIGHCQPGDRVIARLARDERVCDLQVFVTGDLSWPQNDKQNGCIPLAVATMGRLLDANGPHVILPSMTPVVEVISEYSPHAVYDGDQSTDPLLEGKEEWKAFEESSVRA